MLNNKTLQVNNFSFGYDEKIVLKNIEFSLKKGEILSIIGASGSGKSTLLKCIYGLYDLPENSIFWGNEPVKGPLFNLVPGFPKMKYLAQDFGLMPYISVAENVGKFLSNLDLKEKQNRVEELLQMVEMQSFAKIKPLYLSGGQQQRVALAMALAKAPELLLLDEPFSQIDAFLKNKIQQNLFQYLKKKQISCIMATHESTDALAFSDKIMIMKEGEKIALDTPEIIYNQQDRYISSLFGQINILTKNKKEIILYPHQIQIVTNSTWKAKVLHSYFYGSFYKIECEDENQKFFIQHSEFIPKGKEIFLKKDID
ncbi:MAG: ABC transporter ATP-binding protein [Capnocytophaga sp.]|nr:ABC transporter ATP-binding protein [Capnocytophaga sp.]